MPIIEHRPRGILRWGLRLPIWLYRLHLGWLLGDRFLLLTHTGRKSGLARHAVVEVVRHDAATDTYFVAAAWGEKSDWFRNIRHNPHVEISVGRRHFHARAESLPVEKGADELLAYARRHPRAFREITRMVLGRPLVGTPENCRHMAAQVPIIALRPAQPAP